MLKKLINQYTNEDNLTKKISLFREIGTAFKEVKEKYEAKVKEEEAKAKAEEEARLKAEEEAKVKAEEEAKAKAEEEAKAKAKAEEEAKAKAEETSEEANKALEYLNMLLELLDDKETTKKDFIDFRSKVEFIEENESLVKDSDLYKEAIQKLNTKHVEPLL